MPIPVIKVYSADKTVQTIDGDHPLAVTAVGADGGAGVTQVTQATHDNLNANANIQVNNVDVGAANPVPVSDGGVPLDALLLRTFTTTSVTIANGAAVSGEIDMSQYSMMIIHMPAAWTAADIGFQVSPTTGGAFQPLYDDLGNIVMVDGPAASRNYQAPPEIAGCGFVQLWSQNGVGVNVNQGGDRVIAISLKA